VSAPLVAIGMHVEVELISESDEVERLALDLVPDSQADFASGFLGESTPLARAILGQGAGSVVAYHVGDMRQVRLLAVSPATRAPAEDVEAKRQAVIKQAVAQSELVNDMAFALAVGSKWGDYDPGGDLPGK